MKLESAVRAERRLLEHPTRLGAMLAALAGILIAAMRLLIHRRSAPQS
ncbi:hypothetical protein [Methylobacterium terricola]|nr:hypothetical protein [Methylobacterium terricola]